MSSAIARARADIDRSYSAAKASVAQATAAMLASGPQGAMVSRPDLAAANEQLRHFSGLVYASIRPIAQRIAGQQIMVGRRSNRRMGVKAAPAQPIGNHPLLTLLADPNDLMVGWSLIYTTVASLELTGRCLWWLPDRKQILPIPTSWITGFDGTTSFEAFRVRPPHAHEDFALPAEQCCYFAYPNPADPHGAVSPLQAAAGAVDADESMTGSQAAMFRNGVHPQTAIILGRQPHPDFAGGLRPHLSKAQQSQIIEAVKKRYAGVERHGEPFILDGMIEDLKRLSNTPQEMDFLNSGKAIRDRVMLGFGVNPVICGQLENANRASALAAEDHFVNYCVNPKIELISQSMTEWLGPMFGEVVIWVEPCTVRDDETKLKWVQALASAGALTGDEMRDLSPFELELGTFPEPVNRPEPDAQLAEAAAGLRDAAAKAMKQQDREIESISAETRRIIDALSRPELRRNGHAH